MSNQLSTENILSTIPPGVNPFTYLLNLITPQFLVPFSRFTTAILITFFTFHLLIAIFCLVLLVLPYLRGIKQSQWLFKRLYIKNHSGENVYQTPLLFVNTGILMTISQFIGSIAAQAFIFIQIRTSHSSDYALKSPLATPMGVMFMCEVLIYWSLSHCFLVTSYYDRKTRADITQGTRTWISPPAVINFVFLSFPIFVVAATIALFTWLSSGFTHFMVAAVKVLDALRQGSSVWDQLKVPSTSSVEKLHLTTQLIQVVSEAKNFTTDVNIRSENLINCFHLVQCVLLIIICITSLVFIVSFWVLVHKFRRRHRQSDNASSQSIFFRRWGKRNNSRNASGEQSTTSSNLNPSFINVVKSDRQFLHLTLRAISIIIAMLTTITLLLLGIIRTADVVKYPYWRGLSTWLTTVSGTWAAIPIAWQCWRLYQEQSGGASQSQSNSNATTLIEVSGNKNADPGRPTHDGAETIEIKVKLDPKVIHPTDTYEK